MPESAAKASELQLRFHTILNGLHAWRCAPLHAAHCADLCSCMFKLFGPPREVQRTCAGGKVRKHVQPCAEFETYMTALFRSCQASGLICLALAMAQIILFRLGRLRRAGMRGSCMHCMFAPTVYPEHLSMAADNGRRRQQPVLFARRPAEQV